MPSSPRSFPLELLSLLNGENAAYITHLYETYRTSPQSVDPEWRSYFETLSALPFLPTQTATPPFKESAGAGAASLQAMALIQAYRTYGYKVAHLDPLGLVNSDTPPMLLPKTYGLGEKDNATPLVVEWNQKIETLSLPSLLKELHAIYQGTLGMEFMHIEEPEQRAWLQEHMEGKGKNPPLTKLSLTPTEKQHLLRKLTDAKNFEELLQKKYPVTHRFSLEGAESLIPGIEDALLHAALLGVKEVVIGMTHRGRLNVLANIMDQPLKDIFYKFQPIDPENLAPSPKAGDVKYHLGASTDRDFQGNRVHLSLLDSPSHLEAIDPVVLGKVRAQQTLLKDKEGSKVLGILLHGDAAFRGQGIVSESLMLSDLKGYTTGGTLHIIINNQIGFTTTPEGTSSSITCANLALAFDIPILHVNGDDPEAVVKVMRLAIQYRQTFKKDVIVNLICYRRHGHNEGDEASFTQPLMSKAIASHPSLVETYAQKLIQEGTLSQKTVEGLEEESQTALQKGFLDAKETTPSLSRTHRHWENLVFHKALDSSPLTGIDKSTLMKIGASLVHVPQSFHLHPKLHHILSARKDMLETSELIDWSLAEALSFGSLLLEGSPVRLSGQDSERGTFSQRHAVWIDQDTEETYIPLNHIENGQARFDVWNSPLAELSILGFELGYSFADPQSLVLWEAQYGDFSNEAQIIVDQFLSSSEEKWLRMSGLVLLLPHGYEGQGPEHSSARLERYLQLCAQDNMQVVNCSTPANYFHVLRRQLLRSYRKPLILMTPKSLLRHKQAVSPLKDLETGTHFQEVIPDHAHSAQRIVLCSGKVYYDLLKAISETGARDISLVRLEQLYPFPHALLLETLKSYPKEAQVIWCQEEPLNMGAWTYLDRRLEAVLIELNMKYSRPYYAGRPESASPATGFFDYHAREQALLIQQALTLEPRKI